jgi:hypothetical protein
MRTMSVRRGDVTSAQKSQELLAQTKSGTISPEQRMRKPVTERHAHEDWKQRIEGDWQNHLETLQRYVCELSRTNQQPRMALTTANEPKRRYGNAINL